MLPAKTRFTPEVINKILDKYRRAIACADTRKRHKNYQDYIATRALILLRDKPECMEKHLTWEVTEKP